MFVIYMLSVLNNNEIIIPYIVYDISYFCEEILKHKDYPEKKFMTL